MSSSLIGKWETEDGERFEIVRRMHGYVILMWDPSGGSYTPADNVRWKQDRLKWRMPDQEGRVLSCETATIELHRIVVRWKAGGDEGELILTRVR